MRFLLIVVAYSSSTDEECKAGWAVTRSLLANAVLPDEWSITPNIRNDALTEELSQDTFVGNLEGNIKTYSSSIFFGVLQKSQIPAVAKYTNNCAAIISNDHCRTNSCPLRSDDELLDEFKMYNAVKELNILPKVFYLSPPVQVYAFQNDKVLTESVFSNNQKDEAWINACAGRAKARMMVQAKVGGDMVDFTNHIGVALKDETVRLTVLRSIVQVGVQLIELLQKLHNAGIIHGDIHEGNAAFERDFDGGVDWTSNRVVLLDLGMARFYPDEIGRSEEQPRLIGTSPDMLSPWNIANYRVGRRDDLYRAMELVCNLMMELSLSDYLKRNPGEIPGATSPFASKLNEMRKITDEEYFLAVNKMNANLFQTDHRINKPSPLFKFGLYGVQEKTILSFLDEVVTQIRSIPSVDTRPKYDEYITLMNRAIEFIDNIPPISGLSNVQPHLRKR